MVSFIPIYGDIGVPVNTKLPNSGNSDIAGGLTKTGGNTSAREFELTHERNY